MNWFGKIYKLEVSVYSMITKRVKGGYMEKNKKRFLVFSVLAMFMFMFAMQFVAANNPIGDWFTNWEDGKNFSANIAKYLFWALVSMLIYGISEKFPGLDNKEYIKWPFAIVVGFLSMAYVTPEEIFALMGAYSGMGFVMSMAVPFLILIFFTADIAGKEGSPKERVMYELVVVGMWFAFTVFLLIRAINAPTGSVGLSWILFVIALFLVIAVKPIMGLVKREVAKERIVTIERAGELINANTTTNIKEARAKIDAME